MKLRQAICVVCLLPALALGQTSSTTETVKFLRSAWSTVAREGPKALDKMRARWPEDVRHIKTRVESLQKTCSDSMDHCGLGQRVAMITELWRVRSSINLLALLSPETLEQVAGIDAKTLKALERQTIRLQKRATST